MSEKNDFLGDILLSSDLVIRNLQAQSDLEAIDKLARLLLEKNLVKESYIPAVIKREKEFCTGLAFEAMGVALPHTDAIHVNKQAIAIGILKEPIKFKAMGMPDETVEVSLILMLAIEKPDAQLELLGKLMDILQKAECVNGIKNAVNEKEAVEIFGSFLNG